MYQANNPEKELEEMLRRLNIMYETTAPPIKNIPYVAPMNRVGAEDMYDIGKIAKNHLEEAGDLNSNYGDDNTDIYNIDVGRIAKNYFDGLDSKYELSESLDQGLYGEREGSDIYEGAEGAGKGEYGRLGSGASSGIYTSSGSSSGGESYSSSGSGCSGAGSGS